MLRVHLFLLSDYFGEATAALPGIRVCCCLGLSAPGGPYRCRHRRFVLAPASGLINVSVNLALLLRHNPARRYGCIQS